MELCCWLPVESYTEEALEAVSKMGRGKKDFFFPVFLPSFHGLQSIQGSSDSDPEALLYPGGGHTFSLGQLLNQV